MSIIIYNNRSKFNFHFQSLCNTYGIKRKRTSVKNPKANAILEHIHAVLGNMLRTSKLDMAERMKASDIDVFLSDAVWAVRSTYHTVLKASPGAAIFGRDRLFDIPYIADWQWRTNILISIMPMKTKAELIIVTRLVRKYC